MEFMKQLMFTILIGFILMASQVTTVYAGWNPNSAETAAEQKVEDPEVAQAIADFRNSAPSMEKFFQEAYGFAIFPSVGKGGAGIGGAYGKGKVYSKGILVGITTLMQFTLGLQLGGQAYREIIFFQNKTTLDFFKSGNFEFGAQASAVAATAGVSADTDYNNGVAVFTLTKGGLMFEASIGGQKFSFDKIQ